MKGNQVDRIVFVLSHDYEAPHGDTGKYIGVYSTRPEAEAAISRMAKLPGFADYPKGFVIDEYTLNQDHWTSGFVTIRGAK
jgi:hypothetical protein